MDLHPDDMATSMPAAFSLPADMHDDTFAGIGTSQIFGGIESGGPSSSSHQYRPGPGGGGGRHHGQSHSFDHPPPSPRSQQQQQHLFDDLDPTTRYNTPPTSSFSRPDSGMSGTGDQKQQQQQQQASAAAAAAAVQQQQQQQNFAGAAAALGGGVGGVGGGGGDFAAARSSLNGSGAANAVGGGEQNGGGRNHVVIKVGMVGDAQIGKTSLMVKYVEGSWDEDYIQTLGVNFMEKTISIRNTEITFSIWDLGGQREFVNMLPLVCNDAVAILFMFDLTRKSTLNSIKEWYRQGRGFNKTAIPILVGTKYDHFVNFPREDQEEISNQARRFAKAMRAALIFSSTSHSINVQKIFKIVLSKAFDLKCTIPEIETVGEPLLLYQSC